MRNLILVDSAYGSTILNGAITIQAAQNFRGLRRLGATVRKTIDSVIATCCIESDYDLLHNDRDFEAFVKQSGRGR